MLNVVILQHLQAQGIHPPEKQDDILNGLAF